MASGKNVLVTGVAGIGGGFARKCAAEGAAKVFAVDRDQGYLDALVKAGGPAIVAINADLGTEEGIATIAKAVGDAKLDWLLLAAATVVNLGEKSSMGGGHPLANIDRASLTDMLQTSIHGRLFLLQALMPNIQQGEGKSRVFTVGAPFGDGKAESGPKAGQYMCIPGWGGIGIAKSGCRYLHEMLKVECGAVAKFGYGHPALTKTSLTEGAAAYGGDMMVTKMMQGRFAKEDYHTPDESAALFYAVMERSSDEDFQGKVWSCVATTSTFPDVEVKQTSDMAAGIQLPGK